MIQTLEDIMRACVIDFGGSYHLSIRCAPFEALYGRKCRSPVLWAEIGESSLTGLELVQETTDKVVLVKEKPKAVRDRQKSDVDYRRKPLEFEVGDHVLLKVTPWKGVVHFGKKGKLAPIYIGPFEILESIGLVAYRLRLHEELNSVHDTFHVSNLKKCLADASLHVPLDEIKVDKTFRFVEEPIEIMDREIKKLKRRKITLVKVRWNSKCGPENWKLRFEHSGGLLAGIHVLFSGRYCGLVRRVTSGYPWPKLEGKGFGMIQERFRSSAWCLRDQMSTPTQCIEDVSGGDIRLANDIVQPLSSRVPNQGHQSGLHENSTVSLTDFAYAKCSSQCALSNNSTRAGTYKSQTTTHHREYCIGIPYTHASHRQPIRSEDSNT
ncbi:hypothetical protein Tco_0091070 [Tanacetum coccineum]